MPRTATLHAPATGLAPAASGPTAPPTAGGPLLVALGGPRAIGHVVTAARLLAERLQALPQPVAAFDPFPSAYFAPGMEPLAPEIVTEQRAEIRRQIEADIRLALGAETPWRLDVVPGSPARTLARLAGERHARLIVMGIGRHDAIDRMLGDETTLQTLRLADRPVLAVAPGFDALPRRAIAAIDFSPASVRAAEEALAMLADGGTLTLVHVRPELDAALQPSAEVWLGTHQQRLTDVAERLRAALAERAPHATVETTLLTGTAAETVLALATRTGADLIATGSTGRGFLARLVVGSVASQLLRRSPVSVLAAPTPAAAEVERIERLLSSTHEAAQAERWPGMVGLFSQRNAGRPTRLELDDPGLGAQLIESGYALVGAAYDPHDGRLELMLGDVRTGARRLTHTIGSVVSIAVLTGADGLDEALQVRHERGQTLLTFRD